MKNFINIYKIQLLISLTLAVALIALPVVKTPLNIALVFLFSILGTFILDSDYFIHAYLVETDTPFSKNLRAYIKHKDFFGAITYMNLKGEEVKEKTLHSGLFQILFALFCIFVAYSDVYYPVKVFIISIFANSIYKVIETYFTKDINEWFWSFKTAPDKNGFILYLVAISSIFGYCLFLI